MAYGLEQAVRPDGSLDETKLLDALEEALRPSSQSIARFSQELKRSVLDKIFSNPQSIEAFRKIISKALADKDRHVKKLLQDTLPKQIIEQAKPVKLFGFPFGKAGGLKKSQASIDKIAVAAHQQVTHCPLNLPKAGLKTAKQAQIFQNKCRAKQQTVQQSTEPKLSSLSPFTQQQQTFLKTLPPLSQQKRAKMQRLYKVSGNNLRPALRLAYDGQFDDAYEQKFGQRKPSVSTLAPRAPTGPPKHNSRRKSVKKTDASDLLAQLKKKPVLAPTPPPLRVQASKDQKVHPLEVMLKSYNVLPQQKQAAFRQILKNDGPKSAKIIQLLSQQIQSLSGADKARMANAISNQTFTPRKAPSPRRQQNVPVLPGAPSTAATVFPPKAPPRKPASPVAPGFKLSQWDQRVIKQVPLTQQQRIIYQQKRKSNKKINQAIRQMGLTDRMAEWVRARPLKQRGIISTL